MQTTKHFKRFYFLFVTKNTPRSFYVCFGGKEQLQYKHIRHNAKKDFFISVIMWFGVWLNYFQCQMSSGVYVPT